MYNIIILGLFLLVSSTIKCNAANFVDKVINGTGNIQREAIVEIVNNPLKYKKELMAYLTKNRNWNNEKEWPSDNILYIVGVTRDKDYGPVLLSFLNHAKYCNKQIPEYTTGLEVALTLIMKKENIVLVQNKPGTVVKDNLIAKSKDFFNAIPITIKERKNELTNSVKYRNEVDRLEFVKMQSMGIKELIRMLNDQSIEYKKREMAVICLRYLVDNKQYIPDLLYFAINSPNDGAHEYLWDCVSGIYNIYIQNGENK